MYADHDHGGEYADLRHDHDNDYAPLHHPHYDLEKEDDRLGDAIRELGDALGELRGELQAALDRIRVLDRLRPTCVICLDATADRQTARGPACTDCAGDLHGDDSEPDPDRPETGAFPEEPEESPWPGGTPTSAPGATRT